ncbi:MAG: ABC transporter permease [candidate division Zixibacteria bacterium]|nr:ABC transporter permease [candidate division Zixibacteria bacterium]
MGKYTLRRLMHMIPVLFIVSIVVFLIIHLIPGDPAEIMAGTNATEEQVAALRHQYGLDRPLWIQYFIWLGNVFSGNLGHSIINGFPVNELLKQRIPATIELAIAAAIVGAVIALPLGIIAALRPGSVIDFSSTLFSALSFAVPGFWLAILFILLFSLHLKILPPSGRPEFSEQPLEHLKSLIMPALVLGIAMAAKLTRYLRSSMLDILDQDYTRTARAKGLKEQLVVLRHVLRNSLIPVITVFGLQIGDLLSGAIIIESIFAWPGVGRLTIQAIGWRDYSILQASVMFIVLAFLFVNLITDLAYGYIDPRIRYE